MDEKEWLLGVIKAVIKSGLSDDDKVSQIIQFIESYEAMKEI